MGRRVVRLESTPSTNDIAKGLARAGEPHGTVVLAQEQTRARGQRGRRWVSPRGGLWASLLARPAGVPVAQAGLLNIGAAVAAAEAASAVSGARVMLKWPNDLLVAGRKIGGVLVETGVRGGAVEWAVIGVGINANVTLDAFPGRLRGTAGSLRDAAGCEIPLEGLLREVCARAEELLAMLEAGKHGRIVRRWRALDATPERTVRRARDPRWRARALGIDAGGRLVIRTPQGLTCIATSQGLLIE